MTERDRVRERERRRRAAERDIYIPPVGDPKRRLRCEASTEQFLIEYFPARFYSEFTEDRRRIMTELERRAQFGGAKALAAPRGTGKTTITYTVIGNKGIVTGIVPYGVIVSATGRASRQILKNIRRTFERRSGPFQDDYPEVCEPISALEGSNRRTEMQTVRGMRTEFQWGQDQIVFPVVELLWCPKCYWVPKCPECGERVWIGGDWWVCPNHDEDLFLPFTGKCRKHGKYEPWMSPASGAILGSYSIDGAIRGLNEGDVRPSIVVLDDVETRKSAKSDHQCHEIETIIDNDISGLRAQEKRFGRLMLCTVQTPTCVAAKYTDPQEKPAWDGTRIPQVLNWPKRKDLWERYIELRQDGQRSGMDPHGREAQRFYEEQREEMDDGVLVTNPHNFNREEMPDGSQAELSAIQAIHNLAADDGWTTVFNEYQNQPQDETESSGIPSAADIARRDSKRGQWIVPDDANTLTAFIDVQKDVLWWMVCAWGEGYRGYVIAYGAFPEQRRKYFKLSEVSPTLQTWYAKNRKAGPSMEDWIYAGMDTLAANILQRNCEGEAGEFQVSMLGVDSGWGMSTPLVYNLARLHDKRARIVPTKGYGVRSSQKPMSAWPVQRGERRGLEWHLRRTQDGHRLLEYDANWWKAFVHERLSVEVGGSSALLLHSGHDHLMLADHLTAEYRVETIGNGRTVLEYMEKPGKPDNHWLDCLVGCAVLANAQGVSVMKAMPQQLVRQRRYGVLSKKE